jgi:hypothetical protein
MDLLQRLQPLDYLLVIVWAGVIGWGLQTGFVRQLGMLIGTYAAAIVSGSLYRQAGQALAWVFGIENLPQLEFVGYVGLFVVTFGLVGLIIWQAYPQTRLSRRFGADNVSGAVLAAVWGVLLLIAVLSMLRFYAVVPWSDQEARQRGVLAQTQASQIAPVLQVVMAPLWQSMSPWFPDPVTARL